MNEEPRFGEVWKWQDMGPYMVIGLISGGLEVSLWAMEKDRPMKIVSLMWDQPGRTFREDWHRIDEGELV